MQQRQRGKVKEMRRATGTWLTPRHACEAAVLLMVGGVRACQQQRAAENTAVSHQTLTHTHTQAGRMCPLNDIQMHNCITNPATTSCQSSVEDLSLNMRRRSQIHML